MLPFLWQLDHFLGLISKPVLTYQRTKHARANWIKNLVTIDIFRRFLLIFHRTLCSFLDRLEVVWSTFDKFYGKRLMRICFWNWEFRYIMVTFTFATSYLAYLLVQLGQSSEFLLDFSQEFQSLLSRGQLLFYCRAAHPCDLDSVQPLLVVLL